MANGTVLWDMYEAAILLDLLLHSKSRVAIDEVKSVSFTNDKELAGIFKGYMENGFVNVDGEAGIIFLGNIDVADMDGSRDMLRELPDLFRDSALEEELLEKAEDFRREGCKLFL